MYVRSIVACDRGDENSYSYKSNAKVLFVNCVGVECRAVFPGMMAECLISIEPDAELLEGKSPQALQGGEVMLRRYNQRWYVHSLELLLK